jgi:hypothetical protein
MYIIEKINFFFVPTELFAPVDYNTTLDTIDLRITVSESNRQNLNIQFELVATFVFYTMFMSCMYGRCLLCTYTTYGTY